MGPVDRAVTASGLCSADKAMAKAIAWAQGRIIISRRYINLRAALPALAGGHSHADGQSPAAHSLGRRPLPGQSPNYLSRHILIKMVLQKCKRFVIIIDVLHVQIPE